MTKRLLLLLGIFLTILVGTYFSWKLCCPHNLEENQSTTVVIETPKQKSPTSYPFSVKDKTGNFSLTTTDNFDFEKSAYTFLSPVTSSLDVEIEKLKNHLNSNSNKTLSITGFYTENEENTSAYPNLGFARAISVKNYLSSKGIPSKTINTFGAVKETMVADSLNVLYGPIDFAISEFKDNSEELQKLGNFIKEHPLVLYFKTGETKVNLTPEQRQEIADIANYLDKVEGASCIITGHTDNTGDPNANIAIGQKRADFAKQYLVNNGIPADKIEALSQGQNEPIADNSTEEGKAKNRRTIITIK
ncbi:outer membrane protein OmpA-like peptidoglycan-associated protein [Tenacibaculum skagerrakense]|uniref:Outer membrane protein OmpA-like peptidoglycan-associated protein n=1 Tax=Tenacibaculum skagerrakense TaxID=186571 RepID=A0A4R2P260_9FLAO|nr:OmpA family protein [Tenacibaculum skagerrakense]TCP28024.1 outer membrane protein OmpA-like peptidoglycan-associated protein [Tenacibaculum skagerrakense]